MAERLIEIPPMTIAEAEQSVYNLDEALNCLDVIINSPDKHDYNPDLLKRCIAISKSVRGGRDKLHQGLINAGVEIDPPQVLN